MAKKPLNPDSIKGGGMPAMGRSSQGASAAANKRAGAGAAAKRAQAVTKAKTTTPKSSEYVITPTGKRVRKTDLVRSSMLNDYLGFRNTKPRGK